MVSVRRSRRSSVRPPSSDCAQVASSTSTCAMVTGVGPLFTTRTRSSPGRGSAMRSMESSSTGGKLLRKTPTGPKRRKPPTSRASSSSGPAAFSQGETPPLWERSGGGAAGPAGGGVRGAAGGGVQGASGTGPSLDVEHARPPELGELALVRVEHVLPRVLEGELQHRPLALAEHH